MGKAVISGVGGAAAAMAAGAFVGSMVPVPVVGTVGGLAFGLVTSGALDWAYDGLPQGVKDIIEGGFSEAGDAIGDVGGAIGSGAKKTWDAIF